MGWIGLDGLDWIGWILLRSLVQLEHLAVLIRAPLCGANNKAPLQEFTFVSVSTTALSKLSCTPSWPGLVSNWAPNRPWHQITAHINSKLQLQPTISSSPKCHQKQATKSLMYAGQSLQQALHYGLRPIESVQFRFDNFATHCEGKCHFLFNWVLLKFL